MNESSIAELGPFHQQGSGRVDHEVVSDRIIKDEEYSARVVLFTSMHTVVSRNYSFSKLVHVAYNSASNSFIDTLYRCYIFTRGTINFSDVHWQVY